MTDVWMFVFVDDRVNANDPRKDALCYKRGHVITFVLDENKIAPGNKGERNRVWLKVSMTVEEAEAYCEMVFEQDGDFRRPLQRRDISLDLDQFTATENDNFRSRSTDIVEVTKTKLDQCKRNDPDRRAEALKR